MKLNILAHKQANEGVVLEPRMINMSIVPYPVEARILVIQGYFILTFMLFILSHSNVNVTTPKKLE